MYVSRLMANLPVARHLDLGFGAHQSWTDGTIQNESATIREFSFFTNLKYHFLPNSVINPFIMIEMGQASAHVEFSNSSDTSTLDSSSLTMGGVQSYSSDYNGYNFFYSGAVGEEFLFSDKASFLLSYKYGVINESNFQYATATLGYWILEKFYIDSQVEFHFTTPISTMHLAGHVLF